MHLRRMLPFLFLPFLLIVLIKCKDIPYKTDKISEGFIEYKIEYLGDSLDQFIQNFLPDRMKIKFKNDNTKNRLESMSGLFDLTNIKNYKNETTVTLINFFNNKYKYVEKTGESSLFFKKRPNMTIQHTEKKKRIAGFTCNEAIITIPGTKHKPEEKFKVYFTKKIDVKGFNDQTPFSAIEGVLMEFQMQFYDIPMKFRAIRVKEQNIPSGEFDIPQDYKQINRKTMIEIIELLK